MSQLRFNFLVDSLIKYVQQKTGRKTKKTKHLIKHKLISAALIWKKREENVFNWSEMHLSEVTSYKIHILTPFLYFKVTMEKNPYFSIKAEDMTVHYYN